MLADLAPASAINKASPCKVKSEPPTLEHMGCGSTHQLVESPLPTQPEVIVVKVMSHMGKYHLFDIQMPRDATAGECIVAIAHRLDADLDKVIVMDVTERIPFTRTANDEELL